jgi:hypothetical protein
MEMNGLRELINVTTVGRWMTFDDFEDIARFILAPYENFRDIKEVIKVLLEVGFLETSDHNDFIRIKKIWYDK